MKKLHLTLLFFLMNILVYGQSLNNNWIYGPIPGLNFAGTSPTNPIPATYPFPVTPITSPISDIPQYLEGCASLSDHSGNLKLFSDGMRMWWQSNTGTPATIIANDLLGNWSDSQNVIFIPRPGHPNRYYVVTLDGWTGFQQGLHYSEVDVTTGAIDFKNRVLSTRTLTTLSTTYVPTQINAAFGNYSQSITSTRHSNGEDYWLIVHVQGIVNTNVPNTTEEIGLLLSYRVTCNGIGEGINQTTGGTLGTATTIQELTLPDVATNLAQSLKVSPSGTRIAMNTQYSGLYYGTFNPTNGTTNFTTIYGANTDLGYASEFSPDSNTLFYSHGSQIIAHDIAANTNTSIPLSTDEPGIQLAENGMIYFISGLAGTMEVIRNPNDNTDLQIFDTNLTAPAISGLPQWVHWQNNPSGGAMVANNDVFNINPCVSNISATTVLQANPSLADVYSGSVTITQVGFTNGITINASGYVTVPVNTAAGTYHISYQLCTTGTCPDCSNIADVTIIVTTTPITPTFNIPASVCSVPAYTLPASSTNSPPVAGTWTLNSNTVTTVTQSGTYIFHPTNAACANEVSIQIQVTPTVTPAFNEYPEYCVGDTIPPLPSASNPPSFIPGYWTLNGVTVTTPTQSGTYVFHPNPGLCATTTTMNIVIHQKVDPVFSIPALMCSNQLPYVLPTNDNNGIHGVWNPTTVTGSGCYIFTPEGGQCANSAQVCIEVIDYVQSDFHDLPSEICSDELPYVLPHFDDHNIAGTWSHNDVDVLEITEPGTYVFTPERPCTEKFVIDIKITKAVVPDLSCIPTILCKDNPVPVLPEKSCNGIPGKWTYNPETGIAIFDPYQDGPCVRNGIIQFTIVDETIVPTFTLPEFICKGFVLPTISDEGVAGTWAPPVVEKDGIYCFTPLKGYCAKEVCIEIKINCGGDPKPLPHIYCIAFDPTGNPSNLHENVAYVNSGVGSISSSGFTFEWKFRFYDHTLLTLYPNENPTFDVFCETNPVMNFALTISNGVTSHKYYGLLTPYDQSYWIPGFGGSFWTCFKHEDCLKHPWDKPAKRNMADIVVYPNPTIGNLAFEGEALSRCHIVVFDLLGNTIIEKDGLQNGISLERYASGIYLYRLTRADGVVQEGKVIKQ